MLKNLSKNFDGVEKKLFNGLFNMIQPQKSNIRNHF